MIGRKEGLEARKPASPKHKAEAKHLLYSKRGKLESQIEQFLDYLKHEKNASPHTISAP